MYHYPRMKDLRIDAELSQKEVATILGTTQQQYQKYESGIQEIPVHHLISLAKLYKTTTDDILAIVVKTK